MMNKTRMFIKLISILGMIYSTVIALHYLTEDGDNGICIFKDKPHKDEQVWNEYETPFYQYNHLFKFIKWEDNEPYNIEELIKGAEENA